MEAPHLQKVYQQYRNRGGVVLGIAPRDDTVASLKAFKARNKVSYPIAIDRANRLFGPFDPAIPMSVLIDRSGVIRQVGEGYSPAEFKMLQQRFGSLLPKLKAPPKVRKM